jgi:hypothetical protein
MAPEVLLANLEAHCWKLSYQPNTAQSVTPHFIKANYDGTFSTYVWLDIPPGFYCLLPTCFVIPSMQEKKNESFVDKFWL